jgi:hypothetical protein
MRNQDPPDLRETRAGVLLVRGGGRAGAGSGPHCYRGWGVSDPLAVAVPQVINPSGSGGVSLFHPAQLFSWTSGLVVVATRDRPGSVPASSACCPGCRCDGRWHRFTAGKSALAHLLDPSRPDTGDGGGSQALGNCLLKTPSEAMDKVP